MSTVHVDDQLYERTRDIAKSQGKSVDEFVSDVLRQSFLAESVKSPTIRETTRNGLPVLVLNGTAPAIEPGAVRRLLEEEGF